jgi:hypothetical protein
MSAVDVHGRIISQAALGCLGWDTGTRVQMQVLAGLIAVTGDRDGRHVVLSRGALRLPAVLRRAYAGHTDNGAAGTIATYVRATIHDIATALAALTREPHPLAT